MHAMPCHATHTLDCTAGIDEADLSFEAGESIVVTTTTTPEAAGQKKTHHLLRRLIALLKMIILARQARDKHRESTQNLMRFLTAEAGVSAADLAPAPPPPPPVNAGYVPAPEEVRTCYDFDENGIVGIADLLSLLSAFGTSGCLDSEPDALHCGYDGTADGVVGVQDLLALLAQFGTTC